MAARAKQKGKPPGRPLVWENPVALLGSAILNLLSASQSAGRTNLERVPSDSNVADLPFRECSKQAAEMTQGFVGQDLWADESSSSSHRSCSKVFAAQVFGQINRGKAGPKVT